MSTASAATTTSKTSCAYQPGLMISSSQGAEDTHVSSRGSGQNNDDIIGLAILVDGIPINQGDGEAFLHDVDLQSVQYAEVYRGADALRYGGVTLGGAINLVSLTGREAAPLSVGISFGSFGYYQQTLSTGLSQGPWDLFAAVLRPRAGRLPAAQPGKLPEGDGQPGLSAERHRGEPLLFLLRAPRPEQPGGVGQGRPLRQPAPDRPRGHPGGLGHPLELHPPAWTALPSGVATGLSRQAWNGTTASRRQRDEYEDDFRLGTVRFYSDDYAADVLFEWNRPLFDRRNRFTAGVLPTFEPESDSFYANLDGKTGARLFADRTYYLNLPLFAEDQFYLTKRFSLLAGFQAVYVDRIFRDGYHSATLGDQSHDDHFRAFNPKGGVAYQWNNKLSGLPEPEPQLPAGLLRRVHRRAGGHGRRRGVPLARTAARHHPGTRHAW